MFTLRSPVSATEFPLLAVLRSFQTLRIWMIPFRVPQAVGNRDGGTKWTEGGDDKDVHSPLA